MVENVPGTLDDIGAFVERLRLLHDSATKDPSLPRASLARLIERMIDRMDDLDGDPDVEANVDELDGPLGENEFHPRGSRSLVAWLPAF